MPNAEFHSVDCTGQAPPRGPGAEVDAHDAGASVGRAIATFQQASTEQVAGSGGELAVAAMTPFEIGELFTLSGGHIFPLLDAAAKRGLRIIDTRHEQTAVFAAEGMAKLTRRPGAAALTAGPGVTNGASGIATAHFNGSPVVILGGRAPHGRWGHGSLQELDHVPLMAPITKTAKTVPDVGAIPTEVHRALLSATAPHRGPVFLDFPLDVLFAHGEGTLPAATASSGTEADPDNVAAAAQRVAGAEAPALIVGSDVYWAGAEGSLRHCVESLRVPAFANGLGRGLLPADHELAFARTRRLLATEADLVVVVGTPLDFRLSFGHFGKASVIHIVDSPEGRAGHVATELSIAGDLDVILGDIAGWSGERSSHEAWIDRLREEERATRQADGALLEADTDPVKPARVYGELRRVLDRDAIVIGDGGDFVSYAGRFVESYQPGCWLDAGPYGCLGTGMGYGVAARLAHPDRQVVLMLGDGAAGFSLMDADTLVRHGLPVVIVIGNNGIWGLEKHPMQGLYGYAVAADLQSGCRYDDVVKALGGAGEVVDRPGEISPALQRAFAADVPYVVNVLTDPEDAYPRSSVLM